MYLELGMGLPAGRRMRRAVAALLVASGSIAVIDRAEPAAESEASTAALASKAPAAIAFWDARHGIAVNPGKVLTTEDGGRNWTVRRRGGKLASPTVVGAADGWVVDGRSLLHTSDRGRSWTRLGLPRPFAWVGFATRSAGWGLQTWERANGDRTARLFRTPDGGRTWTRLRNPCAGWYDFPSATLASPRRGWVACAGQPGVGHSEKAIYETSDGGRSWQLRACACFHIRRGRLSSSGYLAGLDFLPSGTGLLLQHRGVPLQTSRDGGRSWTPTRAAAVEVEYADSASLVSPTVAFALVRAAPRTRLVASTDGMRTWQTVRTWYR